MWGSRRARKKELLSRIVNKHLQADGSYASIEESRFLQISAAEVLRWLNEAATEREAAWNRRLNEWATSMAQGERA